MGDASSGFFAFCFYFVQSALTCASVDIDRQVMSDLIHFCQHFIADDAVESDLFDCDVIPRMLLFETMMKLVTTQPRGSPLQEKAAETFLRAAHISSGDHEKFFLNTL